MVGVEEIKVKVEGGVTKMNVKVMDGMRVRWSGEAGERGRGAHRARSSK